MYQKQVRMSRTLQYGEHIKTNSSQKSSLLKICTGGSLIRYSNSSALLPTCDTLARCEIRKNYDKFMHNLSGLTSTVWFFSSPKTSFVNIIELLIFCLNTRFRSTVVTFRITIHVDRPWKNFPPWPKILLTRRPSQKGFIHIIEFLDQVSYLRFPLTKK